MQTELNPGIVRAARRGRWVIAAALLCVCAFSGVRAQGEITSVLTPDQQMIVERLTNSSLIANAHVGRSPTDIGEEVTLPFRDNRPITLIRKGSRLRSDGSIAWWGEVKETGERAVLSLWGNALLTGYFAYNGTIFAVENVGGGISSVAELGRSNLPDHPNPATARPNGDAISILSPEPAPRHVAPEPAVAPFLDSERTAFEAKNITIDVMLLYTGRVAKRYVRNPDDFLSLAIAEANQAFRNSGLGNIRLRLVYSQLIEYDAALGDQFNHLYAMVDGIGPFRDVKRLRNEKRADIVGLVIDNPTGCGLSTRVGPESDEAFFVVHHACATITMSLSIAHEIGHILGVRHDRLVDDNDSPFAFGHGYVSGTQWRDIMSYNRGCGGCPRIPYWSNPRIMYKGEPTGTAAADSARVILELAERVSKFR